MSRYVSRIEIPLGERIVCVYLVETGLGILLVDTGLRTDWEVYILPYMKENGIAPGRIHGVLITHADIDHCGATGPAVKSLGTVPVMAHALDAPMISDLDAMIAGRYREFYSTYGVGESDGVISWMRENADMAPVTCHICEGVSWLGGPGGPVHVMHLPGHSQGHVGLWLPESREAVIGDAVLFHSVLNGDGSPAFPPTYRYVESYLSTIRRLRALDPEILYASHYAVMSGPQVTSFLDESENLVRRFHDTMLSVIRDSGSITFSDLADSIHSRIGLWPDGTVSGAYYPLYGHIEYGAKMSHIRITTDDGAVKFTPFTS